MAVWWIILSISVAVYALLIGIIFSRAFFSISKSNSLDRGLMSFKERNGKSIVYEPSLKLRKYINQYILSFRGDKKSIICKLNKDIEHIDYDITLFNSSDKVFKIINIRESIENIGYTNTLDLPLSTSYVSISINSINGDKLESARKGRTFKAKKPFYILINCAITITQLFIVKLCLSNLFADVFANDFLSSPKDILVTMGLAILICSMNIFLSLFYISFKSRRGECKSKKKARGDAYGL